MRNADLSRRHLLLGLGGGCSGATLLRSEPLQIELADFTLQETTAVIRQRLGAPTAIGEAGADLITWLYHLDGDHHDPSHSLVFRGSDSMLLSVTRNYPAPVDLNASFRDSASMRTYFWPNKEDRKWSVGVWKLAGDKLAVGMGIAQSGEGTTQGLLIRRSALRLFLPWLDQQMS